MYSKELVSFSFLCESFITYYYLALQMPAFPDLPHFKIPATRAVVRPRACARCKHTCLC